MNMTQLLHVNGSPRGQASRSLKIAHAFLDSCLKQRPETKVDSLDLFEDPLPPCDMEAGAAKNRGSANRGMSSRALFDRFVAADYYLFNIPMWNFGVPYVVKQLVDVVSQPGLTFSLSSKGYTGLLRGKRACAIYTSGVFHPDSSPEFGRDFQSTYFTHWLNSVGVKDVEEIRLNAADRSGTFVDDLNHACARAAELGRRL
jgi:FMN-dependent NADH-azoreductase